MLNERERGDAGGPGGTAHAYSEVRRAILDGTLPSGAVLSQVQLAAQLGVSRTPLREALRLLQTEGLVEAEARRRVRVAAVSRDDLEQIYAMRIALEPLGVRITVPQLNSEQLGQLQTALDDLAVAVDRRQPSEMREPHRRFHFGLVALAGTRLLRSIADLWDHAERYRRLYLAEGPDHLAMYALAHREHAEILAAATDRDGVACGQLVADHLARTALSVLARSHGRREPSAVNEALDLASTRAKRSPRGE